MGPPLSMVTMLCSDGPHRSLRSQCHTVMGSSHSMGLAPVQCSYSDATCRPCQACTAFLSSSTALFYKIKLELFYSHCTAIASHGIAVASHVTAIVSHVTAVASHCTVVTSHGTAALVVRSLPGRHYSVLFARAQHHILPQPTQH